MTGPRRRWLAWGAALVLFLFAGRWLATFLADRWWAAAISPAAEAAVTRWALLGLALDLVAVLVASAWFAAQAMLVARAVGSVQVERRIGNLTLREAIPTRLLLWGALAMGLLLGLVTGVGAHDWRAPLALAWEGVHYGIRDPLLGVDLGVLVASHPVRHLAQRYLTLLVVLGLLESALLYLGIGAFRRHEGRLEVHLDARRHLGGLLAVLALVLAIGYFLAPGRLATSVGVPLADAAATARILASNAAAGAAIAVAAMSLAWALRGRHSLLAAGWAVFAMAALTERLVVPAFLAEAPPGAPPDRIPREMTAVAWGLHLTEATDTATDGTPRPTTLWDEAALARWGATREGGAVLGAWPAGVGNPPAWRVALTTPGASGDLEIRLVAEGGLGAGGLPVEAAQPTVLPASTALPGREGWTRRLGGGVPAGSWPRRLVLAWARQQPGFIPLAAESRLDWELDPAARLARLVPPLDWTLTGVALRGGRVHWVLAGLATLERAPTVAPVPWRGRQVAGVVPSLVGLVDATNGGVRLFIDPAADSLGAAWGRVFGALVEPASALPEAIRADLGYPAEWLEGQLAVLERPVFGLGRRPGERTADGPPRPAAASWEGGAPVRQAMLEDPARAAPAALVTARRDSNGLAGLEVRRIPGSGRLGARSLHQLWDQGGALGRLRDSVLARGDTVLTGPIRWRLAGDRLLAWQGWFAAGRGGEAALLWIGASDGGRPTGTRDPEALWPAEGGDAGGAGAGDRATAELLEALRGWMGRADSALARGDLTAFGRAWEAMRGLLDTAPRE